MNTQVTSAFIAAGGVIAAFLSARWQLHSKMSELELKKQEIEALAVKREAEAEALRQTLMRDVILQRMKAYADLWRVFISYERNWPMEDKPLDAEWATAFLLNPNACNAEHGVFFSEDVYKPFYEYRRRLIDIARRAKIGELIGQKDIEHLQEVSTFGCDDMRSLAGAMKDDLGSYMRVVIQAGAVPDG